MQIKAPRGTNDILPSEIYKWQYIEKKAREITEIFGYKEIRMPIFEETELFTHGIGESTEVVTKQMYTFQDKGGRFLTLKPEWTAPVVRAYLEHKINPDALWKVYYIGPIFRYERPSKGRFRQSHQFGVECIGSEDPALDVEVISLAIQFYESLGIKDLSVEINSIGCSKCRPSYKKVLREFLEKREGNLCEDCKERLIKNPLRILDCKRGSCIEISRSSPHILEFICSKCFEHFEKVKKNFDLLGYFYSINPFIVRGLDYYTRTVFEIVSKFLGEQKSLCGGGRYDDLVEVLGGGSVPGVGFAAGIERVIMVMEEYNLFLEKASQVDVFVIILGEVAENEGLKLLYDLRRNGIKADMDYLGKSLKGQLREASRLGVKLTLILGEDELRENVVTVKDLKKHIQKKIPLHQIVREVKNII